MDGAFKVSNYTGLFAKVILKETSLNVGNSCERWLFE